MHLLIHFTQVRILSLANSTGAAFRFQIAGGQKKYFLFLLCWGHDCKLVMVPTPPELPKKMPASSSRHFGAAVGNCQKLSDFGGGALIQLVKNVVDP